MDGVVWALADTVSGSGVPLLFGASRGDRWGNACAVALGGACGVCLGLATPCGASRLRAALALVRALASLSFSAALLFRHAGGWDSDLGAALCGIPFFHAVCAPSPSPRGLQAALAVVSGLALVIGAVYGHESGRRADAEGIKDWGLLALFAAHAAVPEGPVALSGAALRVGLLAGVALWPWVPEALALLRQGRFPMVVLGLALVTSAMLQGGQARRALEELWRPAGAAGVGRARRGLLLAVAWCLLAAYCARWARWEDAGWAAGALLLGRAACGVWG